MTSASELFQSWRSRPRARHPVAGGPVLSDLRHSRPSRRRLNHRDDCPRGGSPAVHEYVNPDRSGSSESGAGDGRNPGTSNSRLDRLRLNRNDQLPGAVLLARARLLERLRGVSLSGSRQGTAASSVLWDESEVNDDFIIDSRGLDPGDLSDLFEPGIHFTYLVRESNRGSSSQISGTKPPGLSQKAFYTLKNEAYKEAENSDEMAIESLECCICLEKFVEGDGLVRLLCGHRFHCACLEPWVRTCGDCPYCRASIVVQVPES